MEENIFYEKNTDHKQGNTNKLQDNRAYKMDSEVDQTKFLIRKI